MILIVVMGVSGLIWPSVPLSYYGLGLGQVVFSTLLIGLGSAAVMAWWQGSAGARDAERIFLIGIAALSLAYGLSLWIVDGGAGAQSAMRILAAGVGTLSWVGARHEFGVSRSAIEKAVAHIDGTDEAEET